MPGHVYFVYYVLSFGVGAAGLAFAWLRQQRTGDRLDRLYFGATTSILVTICCMTISAYLPEANATIGHEMLNLLSLLALAGSTVFEALFVAELLASTSSTVRVVTRVFAGTTIVVANGVVFLHWTRLSHVPVFSLFVLFSAATATFLCSPLLMGRTPRGGDPARPSLLYWRRIVARLSLALVAFVPPIVLFDLLALPIGSVPPGDLPKFTPLMFLVWNVVFIYSELGIRHGGAQPPTLARREPGPGVSHEVPGPQAVQVWQRFGLSAREREVADLLIVGFSYKEIAGRLYVSPGTVKTHVLRVYRKTGTNTKVQLLRLARGESDS